MSRYATAALLGLLASVSVTSAGNPVGQRLPSIAAPALTGKPVVLPDSAAGRITLVGFGFTRPQHDVLDAWLKTYEEAYPDRSRFEYYEVPMMGGGTVRLLGSFINMMMKKGLPRQRHQRTMPFYEDYGAYAAALGMADRRVHLFLLDRSGIIRWQDSGAVTPAGLTRLESIISGLD